MTTFAQSLNDSLKSHIATTLSNYYKGNPLPENIDFWTESFGETLEKLIIEHIRAWHIEDETGAAIKANDNEHIVALKRKLDTCWKIRRPRLVEAINRRLDDTIAHQKSATEDSVKLYKGYP